MSNEIETNQEILLAIDPGDAKSAFVFVDMETYKPLYVGKDTNDNVRTKITEYIKEHPVKHVAIEMIASYGMAVGKTVFMTCVEVGILTEYLRQLGCEVDYIYRKDEKICMCGNMRAKDSNVYRALIDRFAKFDHRTGKGIKDKPDWFWGFKQDMWQSYAVAVTWLDVKHGFYRLMDDTILDKRKR